MLNENKYKLNENNHRLNTTNQMLITKNHRLNERNYKLTENFVFSSTGWKELLVKWKKLRVNFFTVSFQCIWASFLQNQDFGWPREQCCNYLPFEWVFQVVIFPYNFWVFRSKFLLTKVFQYSLLFMISSFPCPRWYIPWNGISNFNIARDL